MPDSLVNSLRQGVANACGTLATLGRLHALRNLGGCDVIAREAAARDFVFCVDAASQLENFANRYYHARLGLVSWPLALQRELDAIIVGGEIDLAALEAVTVQVAASATEVLERLRSLAEHSLLAQPLVTVLRGIEMLLPGQPLHVPDGSTYSAFSRDYHDGPGRVFRGPTTVHLGPEFKPTYSLTDRRPPEFGSSIEENVPYFWLMAARETLASQMCALSAVEYDGLPLAFYSDMAKQCWDEARHSLNFLNLAQEMATHELKNDGFPIPGNFYEAMLNADLVQRLVLMNHRTEAPAIPAITRRLASDFCKQHSAVTEFYEFDRIDETSHASIGNRWLRHLAPDESERGKMIEEADLLRGLLLLTTFAHHGDGSLTELATRFS